MSTPYAAVVLTGGRGSRLAERLGGRSKPELVVGGVRLLDRVLGAVTGADPVVVVGPAVDLPAGVLRVQEDPPGGGPVAGLAAAAPLLRPTVVAPLLRLGAVADSPITVVLAGDLPFLSRDTIDALVAGCTGEGCVLVDGDGRDQLLVGAWRRDALEAALGRLPSPYGASWRSLVAGLDIHRLALPRAPGAPAPWWDCDTVGDLDRAEEWL